MTRKASEKQQDLARTIKHQAGTQATRRLLGSLPMFKVVKDVPEHLQSLLDRLEAMETSSERSERS
jgi:hypothetical protein